MFFFFLLDSGIPWFLVEVPDLNFCIEVVDCSSVSIVDKAIERSKIVIDLQMKSAFIYDII